RRLGQQLAEARRTRDRSRASAGVLGEVLRLKRSGQLPGIEGRLGSLASIDRKYDVAVSTAAPLLWSVLVDSADTGAACVRHLKDRRLGRANFLLLDKQSHFAEVCGRRVLTPEHVPRLFDLVKTQPRYRTAFYCALRDTLFAEEIEQAVRIASSGGRRWRVVTAIGELLDASGTMSGGGRTKRRGGIEHSGQKPSGHDAGGEKLAVLEAEFDATSERLRKLSSAEKSLADRADLLKTDFERTKLKAKKLQIDLADGREIARSLELKLDKRRRLASESEEEFARKKKASAEELARAEGDLSKAEFDAKNLTEECAELESRLFESGGKDVKRAKEALAKLDNRRDAANSKLAEMNAAVSLGEKNVRRGKAKLADLEKRLSEAREALGKLEKRSTEIEAEAKKLLKAQFEEKKKRGEEQAKINARKEALADLEEEGKRLRLSLVDIEDQLKDFNVNLESNRAKIAAREKKKDELLNKIRRTEEILAEDDSEGFRRFTAPPNDLDAPPGNKNELEADAERLKNEMEEMEPNMAVIEEYRAKLTEYKSRIESLGDATRRADSARHDYDEFRKARFLMSKQTLGVYGWLLGHHEKTEGGLSTAHIGRRRRIGMRGPIRPLFRGNRVFSPPSEKKLEKYLKFVRRRKNVVLVVIGVRLAPFQTDSAVRDGRNRCCTRLQERFHCGPPHPVSAQRRAVCDCQSQTQHV
ncbi:Structural maintenance of chromosomes protein 4, partial [Bonamia ostreae]